MSWHPSARLSRLLFFALALLLATRGSARACVSASEYMHIVSSLDLGMNNHDIALMDARLYLANESLGLAVVDVADPYTPTLVAHLSTGSPITQVEAIGGRIYLTDATGLRILKSQRSGPPVQLGSFGASGTKIDLKVEGNLVFLLTAELGLRIIDVSNPALPVQRSSVATNHPSHLRVFNGFAFLDENVTFGANSTLRVLDVHDANNPTTVATLPNFCLNGAVDMATDGQILYALDDSDALPVIDVHTPSAPVRLAGVPYSDYIPPESIALENGIAYLTTYEVSILATWDLSTPATPHVDGRLELDNNLYSPFRVVTQHPFAYLMAGPLLQVIDVSSPHTPSLLGGIDTVGSAEAVALNGTSALVADGAAGFATVNLTDPVHPSLPALRDTPGFAYDAALAGSLALIADGPSGLALWNVGNPAAPILLGGLDTPGTARGVVSQGNRAYVADDASGLQVIDISTPSAPALLGQFDTAASSRAVAVSGSLAVLAESGPGANAGTLRVIDAANPNLPALSASLPLSAPANDVALDGNRAYLALGDPNSFSGGIAIVDLTNPHAPSLIIDFDLVSDMYSLVVRDQMVYVAGRHPILSDAGVQYVIDVSTPSQPVVRQILTLPVPVRGVAVNSNIVLLADGASGVFTAAAQCSRTSGLDDAPLANRLRVDPNPMRESTLILAPADQTGDAVTIFDAAGRRVRRLEASEIGGNSAWHWDGRDTDGHRLPSGIYLARVDGDRAVGARILLVR
ncbi:MAG: FlgD immunoglobulin-like domain containing protein [Candidatus Eisenbacteria bacterium]